MQTQLSSDCVFTICKLLGVKLPKRVWDLNAEEASATVNESLKLHEKYDAFRSVVDFMIATNRDHPNQFLFKAKHIVNSKLSAKPWYRNLSEASMNQQLQAIEESVEVRRTQFACQHQCTLLPFVRQYANHTNSGQKYLSIDIRHANYSMIQILLGTNVEWPEFFRSLIPHDFQSRESQTTVSIPQALYESKFVRVFVLSDLQKLQKMWQLETMQIVEKLKDDVLTCNEICINSDEIVVKIDSYMEGRSIIDQIHSVLPKYFRVAMFEVQAIPDTTRHESVKIYQDGSKRLINVHPDQYDAFYKQFILAT